MHKAPVIAYSRGDAGHRRSLINLMKRELGSERQPAAALWFAKAPVLFLMIEENFPLFCSVVIVRAVLGRRTVGFCLRPKPVLLALTLRARIKQRLLRVIRRIPLARIVTFLPFYVDPRIARIATDWIYDPQLWDLGEAERAHFVAAQSHRTGRKPRIVAAGYQSREKGFDRFVALAQLSALPASFEFHAVGRIHPQFKDAAAVLTAAGGHIEDREVSDGELLAAYAEADLIWGHYAPDYDQASGVVSRAAQLGIPVIVRPGSLMEAVCSREGLPHRSVAELQAGAPVPPRFDGSAFAKRFRSVSLATLRRALGLSTEVDGAA